MMISNRKKTLVPMVSRKIFQHWKGWAKGYCNLNFRIFLGCASGNPPPPPPDPPLTPHIPSRCFCPFYLTFDDDTRYLDLKWSLFCMALYHFMLMSDGIDREHKDVSVFWLMDRRGGWGGPQWLWYTITITYGNIYWTPAHWWRL